MNLSKADTAHVSLENERFYPKLKLNQRAKRGNSKKWRFTKYMLDKMYIIVSKVNMYCRWCMMLTLCTSTKGFNGR